jgi:hypothetical protein
VLGENGSVLQSLRRLLLAVVLLSGSAAVALAPTPPVVAADPPVHTLSVSGTGVASYPDYNSAIERYAVTTTEQTGGTVTVHATTSDPAGVVRVDGRVAPGGTATVSGLSGGDEVSVFIEDSAGLAVHSLVYLPAGFPVLEATGPAAGLAPGVVGLTLSTIFSSATRYVTTVDRSGVPTHVMTVTGGRGAFDLKDQPDGSITFSETTDPAGAGEEVVVLDPSWHEVTRHRTVGLQNTDLHDSILLPDGSRFLMAYEPRGADRLDSVIQRIDASGDVTFQWSSEGLEDESALAEPSGRWDYAHMNSMMLLADDDLLVSFRHLDAVFRIATVAHDGYAPGEVVWKLGGKDSDFTFPDDPDHGPCAQHAATMLPNGHVMVFDNGSGLLAGNLCVDPSDPNGPSVARPHTRVVEYTLDTTAGVASVVWSHTPAVTGGEGPWYAWFMGSARRLPNGDTLIGWSAETRALATEVAADGDEIWRLRLAEPKPSPPMISYRASLMQERDAEPPVVDQVSLAEGSTFALGQPVTVDFRCTDRGGSSLQTCAGDVRPGGALNTSTPGAHTVRLVATDGDGGTTTVTRHYTVAATYAPRWGDDRVRRTLRDDRVSTRVRLVNEGDWTDSFRLSGTSGNAGFAITYRVDGKDVTRAVRRGRFRTAALAPGRSVVLQVVVARTDRTRPDAHRAFRVRAVSVTDPTRRDAVRVIVRAP